MRALRVSGPLVVMAAALLLWAAPGAAQEKKAEVLALRIVTMKASGKRAGDDEPRSDPSVRAYLPVLKPLGYDYYRGGAGLLQRAPVGQDLHFTESLPLDYRAHASWKRIGKNQIKLVVSLERPEKGSEKGKLIQVLKATVETRDGQHFVIRVAKAFPDGDLILLMTAQAEAP